MILAYDYFTHKLGGCGTTLAGNGGGCWPGRVRVRVHQQYSAISACSIKCACMIQCITSRTITKRMPLTSNLFIMHLLDTKSFAFTFFAHLRLHNSTNTHIHMKPHTMSTILCSLGIVVFGSFERGFFLLPHLLLFLLCCRKCTTKKLYHIPRIHIDIHTQRQISKNSKVAKTWLRFYSSIQVRILYFLSNTIFLQPKSGQKQIEPWFTFILSTLARFRHHSPPQTFIYTHGQRKREKVNEHIYTIEWFGTATHM